jgi:hypothetical protein
MHSGKELQHHTECTDGASLLTQSRPHRGCALQGPRRARPAPIEPEWNGECGEQHAEREERIDEQAQAFAAPVPKQARERADSSADIASALHAIAYSMSWTSALCSPAATSGVPKTACCRHSLQLNRASERIQHGYAT